MSAEGHTAIDSAGVTCRYTRPENLRPGDVFIVGWRSTVAAMPVVLESGEVVVETEEERNPTRFYPGGGSVPVVAAATETDGK